MPLGVIPSYDPNGETLRFAVYSLWRDHKQFPRLADVAVKVASTCGIDGDRAKRAIVGLMANASTHVVGLGHVVYEGHQIDEIAVNPALFAEASDNLLAHVDWDNVRCFVEIEHMEGQEFWYEVLVAVGEGDSELARTNKQISELAVETHRLENKINHMSIEIQMWEDGFLPFESWGWGECE